MANFTDLRRGLILAGGQKNQRDEQIIATSDRYANYPKIIIMKSFVANLELCSSTCLSKFNLKFHELGVSRHASKLIYRASEK